jgi:hypothetical protein
MNQTTLPGFRQGLRVLLLPLLLWSSVCLCAAGGSELKYEAQLIWATNDKKSPDPKHKPVEPEVKKKLGELPLKWDNYFEVKRKQFTVSKGSGTKAPMSEKCALEVKHLEGDKVEVSLFGKGEAVLKRTQALTKGEILVLGGNAPNETAWLVTLKRIE